MANFSLATANRVAIVGFPVRQLTLPAAEAITAGNAVRIDASTGKFTKANATDTTEGRVWGVAVSTVPAGMPVTAVAEGILDGWDFGSTGYGADVFLSDTDGAIADAAGTIDVKIGRIVAGTSTLTGTAYDRLLEVNVRAPADIFLDQHEVLITSELLAASVDKWVFVADRAYKVLAVREVHSVVGGSGAVVRPRKVTAAATDAPGATAGATVKELTAADIDLTAAIDTVQSPALTATAADLLLAAGDKIGLNFGGTLTGLVGLIEIVLKPV